MLLAEPCCAASMGPGDRAAEHIQPTDSAASTGKLAVFPSGAPLHGPGTMSEVPAGRLSALEVRPFYRCDACIRLEAWAYHDAIWRNPDMTSFVGLPRSPPVVLFTRCEATT